MCQRHRNNITPYRIIISPMRNRNLGLSIGRVGLGLDLTCTRINRIGWLENGPTADRIFGSNLMARVIDLVGRIRRVISSLKHNNRNQNPNNKQIQVQTVKTQTTNKSKSKPKTLDLWDKRKRDIKPKQQTNPNPNKKPKSITQTKKRHQNLKNKEIHIQTKTLDL